MFFNKLKQNEQDLIKMISNICYGQLEKVFIKDGCICFTNETIEVLNIKLLKVNTEHHITRNDGDFQLKENQVNLIKLIRSQKKGVIRSIKIHDGLPTEVQFAKEVML